MKRVRRRAQHRRVDQPSRRIDAAELLKLLIAKHPRLCTWQEITQHFKIRRSTEEDTLRLLLGKEVEEGRIHSPDNASYGLIEGADKGRSYVGDIDKVRPMMAYVSCEELKDRCLLEGQDIHHLFHGDRVRFGVLSLKSEMQKAYLIEVLSHGARKWVGRLDAMGSDFSFQADSRRLHKPLTILKKDASSASEGDKVCVQPLTEKRPLGTYGRVVEVLGTAGVHEVEMHSILQEFEISTRFPKDILQEAEELQRPETNSYPSRKDFRAVPCLTIDPEDAKDFDDALTFRDCGEDRFEIGIHIADVSHYVRPKTLLDREAQRRGTSIYLVDRTVPMLPERLSNDICSLRPGVDRLTFSAVFVMDSSARIHHQWFGKTVIRSWRRFTYNEVRTILEDSGIKGDEAPPQTDNKDQNVEWRTVLGQLNALAQQMRKQRFEAGAMRLNSLEFIFTLDKEGRPLGIEPKAHHFVHELIEEFMLLANKSVSEQIHKQQKTKHPLFVYRVHEPPEMEKLETFARFARQFDHPISWVSDRIAFQINELLKGLKGKPEEHLLNQLAIRSMSKARYTTAEIPHFGLGFKRYTHFTSPIRRYPDILAHRLLEQYLDGASPKDDPPHEALCLRASELERNAIEAERASIKYKQAEFMKQYLGEVFQGIVSGVTDWGFFVTILPSHCEGLVRLATLKHDYYVFDAAHLVLRGQRSGHQIRLGDEISVRVREASPQQRQIDLSWENHHERRASSQRKRPFKSRQRHKRSSVRSSKKTTSKIALTTFSKSMPQTPDPRENHHERRASSQRKRPLKSRQRHKRSSVRSSKKRPPKLP